MRQYVYSYSVNEYSNTVYLVQLHVMFVCLFIVVLCFSLEFSSNNSSTSCCCCCRRRCMYCEHYSIKNIIKNNT